MKWAMSGGKFGPLWGPLGFAAGILMDYLLDRENKFSEHDQKRLLELTFGLCGKIANADGKVTEEEIELTRRELLQGVGEGYKAIAESAFNMAVLGNTPVAYYVEKYIKVNSHYKYRLHVSEFLLRLALCDRNLHLRELDLLRQTWDAFKINKKDLIELEARVCYGCFAIICGKIALINDEIGFAAREIFRRFYREVFGIKPENLLLFERILGNADKSLMSFEKAFEQVQSFVPHDGNEMRKKMFSLLFEISSANGVILPSQYKLLKAAAKFLDLNCTEFLEQTSYSLDECYSILECSSEDSIKQIKRQYYNLVKQYHPDTIRSKDLAPGFVEYANQQTARINEAYKIVLLARKMEIEEEYQS